MRPTLLYDGDCRFCRFGVRQVVRLDGRRELDVLPFTDPAGAGLLASVPAPLRTTTWHLLRADGSRVSGGDALIELAAQLPATRRLRPVLRRLPLASLYELAARNRGRLGRLVPDGPAPRVGAETPFTTP